MLRPLEKIAAKMWPGAAIIPSMSVGATDGVYTSAAGLPTYLVSVRHWNEMTIALTAKTSASASKRFIVRWIFITSICRRW